jgi:hypothetical protein
LALRFCFLFPAVRRTARCDVVGRARFERGTGLRRIAGGTVLGSGGAGSFSAGFRAAGIARRCARPGLCFAGLRAFATGSFDIRMTTSAAWVMPEARWLADAALKRRT